MTQAGQLRVDGLDVNPNPVAPGTQVTVKPTIRETAEFIGPLDPDLCNPTGIQTQGIECEVTVAPSWAGSQDRLLCVPVWAASSGRRSPEFVFPAPSNAGSYAVNVTVELTGSGKLTTVGETLVVEEDASVDACNVNSDCAEGFVCRDGECVPEDGLGGGDGQLPKLGNLAGLAVVGVGLYAVAKVAGAAEELAEPDVNTDGTEGETEP